MTFFSDHLGEIAALGAALFWVFTSLAFAAAGRRIGPTAVNFTRLFLAVAVLLCINRVLFDRFLPPTCSENMIVLAISGVIGLTLGDQLYFTALIDIGPRLATLFMTSSAPVTALLAWPLLDEPLGWTKVLGIGVTMGGVAWVAMERPSHRTQTIAERSHRLRGMICGAGFGICQAVGLLLSKIGMGQVPSFEMARVDPWTAVLYRMLFAALAIAVVVGAGRCLRFSARKSARRERASAAGAEARLPGRRGFTSFALAMVCVGVMFGPVLGVWSSMVGVAHAPVGVAATLMSMTPVFILPFAIWIEREHISWRATIGAGVAVAGVGLLTLGSGAGGG